MKIWTNNEFKGHWPVGSAAVAIADTQEKAAAILTIALNELGLEDAKLEDMVEMPFKNWEVRVLCDGEY